MLHRKFEEEEISKFNRIRVHNGTLYVREANEKEWLRRKDPVSSRKNSWVTIEQFDREFSHLIKKLAEVLFSPEYSENSKKYMRSVSEFLLDHGWLSWKQLDSWANMKPRPYRHFINQVTGTKMLSDREVDKFSTKFFGSRAMTEEEDEGWVKDYDKSGKTFFRFPTDEDMRIEDAL